MLSLFYWLKQYVPLLRDQKPRWVKQEKTEEEKGKDSAEKETEKTGHVTGQYKYIDRSDYPSFIRKDYSSSYDGENIYDEHNRSALVFFSAPDPPPDYDPSSERPYNSAPGAALHSQIQKRKEKLSGREPGALDRKTDSSGEGNSRNMPVSEPEEDDGAGSDIDRSDPMDIPGAYPTIRKQGRIYRIIQKQNDGEL